MTRVLLGRHRDSTFTYTTYDPIFDTDIADLYAASEPASSPNNSLDVEVEVADGK